MCSKYRTVYYAEFMIMNDFKAEVKMLTDFLNGTTPLSVERLLICCYCC